MSLLSGSGLARNAAWNFTGMAAPLAVGIVAIPLLVDQLGTARFGLLALIWVGVGYFSVVDLGAGRALTKLLAEKTEEEREEAGPLIWTAIAMVAGLGAVGALVVGASADLLVSRVLNVEADMEADAISAFRMLALGLPAVVTTSAILGILQAHQRFAAIAAVRIPLGAMTFLGPLIVVQFTPSLFWATAALVLARALALGAYAIVAACSNPALKHPCRPQTRHVRSLAEFGGWVTVTNLISPLMVYFDRFFIGAIISLPAVAYYVTPYEILSRLRLVPRSVMGVLFPALTYALKTDRARMAILYRRSGQVLLALMLPLIAGLFLLGPEVLGIWLSSEFRDASTPVLRWLAVGWLINILAHPAFTALESAGRPDLIAKLQLAEVIPYAATVWVLTHMFGITGTAAAWFLRVLIDAAALNLLVRVRLPEVGDSAMAALRRIGAILVGFLCAWIVEPLVLRMVLACMIALACLVYLWPAIKTLVWGSRSGLRETSE